MIYCYLGANVTIEDSIIWDNTHIEDDCRVSNSVLCMGVRLYKNTKILPGNSDSSQLPLCILGTKVIDDSMSCLYV